MNPRNNKRKIRGSSYFDPLISQFNGDIFKAPAKILKDKMKKLVIDIVRGNVPYEKYGKYFTDVMIYYLADYVMQQYNHAAVIKAAMEEYAFNHPDSGIIQVESAKATNEFNAWVILKTNMEYLHASGDVQTVLARIPNQMRDNYKNSIK